MSKFCNENGCQDECVFKLGLINNCEEAIILNNNGLDEESCEYYVSQDYLDAREETLKRNIKIRNDFAENAKKLRKERDEQSWNLICFLRDGYYKHLDYENEKKKSTKKIEFEYSGLRKKI